MKVICISSIWEPYLHLEILLQSRSLFLQSWSQYQRQKYLHSLCIDLIVFFWQNEIKFPKIPLSQKSPLISPGRKYSPSAPSVFLLNSFIRLQRALWSTVFQRWDALSVFLGKYSLEYSRSTCERVPKQWPWGRQRSSWPSRSWSSFSSPC